MFRKERKKRFIPHLPSQPTPQPPHSHRPWDMLLVVHGFPTRSQALAFEWAWQHPAKSRAARAAVAGLPSSTLTHPAGRMRTLIEMLHLPLWRAFPLEVAVTSSAHESLVASAVAASGRAPPPHMNVGVVPLDVLAAGYAAVSGGDDEEESGAAPSESDADAAPAPAAPSPLSAEAPAPDCAVCGLPMPDACLPCAAPACDAACHVDCLADHFLSLDSSGGVLPTAGACPTCAAPDTWVAALARQTRAAPSAWGKAWKRTAARGKVRRRKVPTLKAAGCFQPAVSTISASTPASPAKRAAVASVSASAPTSPAPARVVAPVAAAVVAAAACVDEIIILSSDEEDAPTPTPTPIDARRGGALPQSPPPPLPRAPRPPAAVAWHPPLPPPAMLGLRQGGRPPRPPRLPGRWRAVGAVVGAAFSRGLFLTSFLFV